MALPSIFRILNKGLIAGVLVSISSFFFNIVPCMQSLVVVEPKYEWALCKFPNPFTKPILGISQKFYNLFTEPLSGLVLQFAISSILFTLIFMLFRRKARKVLDLSHK